MKLSFNNIFFLVGLLFLAIMAWQLDWSETLGALSQTGYWFLAVLGLWLFLYMFNTFTWMIIIRFLCKKNAQESEDTQAVNLKTDHVETEALYRSREKGYGSISLLWLYKVTVSAFSLNYATPGGLMGGEPYRIMSLTPYVGVERATSSVILFVMTHIYSHFWFWALSVLLFLSTESLTPLYSVLLVSVGLFCSLGFLFFRWGYRKGLAMTGLTILTKVWGVRKWAVRFIDDNRQRIEGIDSQISSLRTESPRTFYVAVLSELLCRVLSAWEVMFVFLAIGQDVPYSQCVLIIAFTTLFANLLFFMPLQLGGREGGFLMSVTSLSLPMSCAIVVALVVRLREIIYTAIGLLLIKIGGNMDDVRRNEQKDV